MIMLLPPPTLPPLQSQMGAAGPEQTRIERESSLLSTKSFMLHATEAVQGYCKATATSNSPRSHPASIHPSSSAQIPANRCGRWAAYSPVVEYRCLPCFCTVYHS